QRARPAPTQPHPDSPPRHPRGGDNDQAMFMLGPALRDARLRRGLELEEVEEQTRISRRYLRALEEENFELLPGDAYATAFLRSYAAFLGLDPKHYVDEYNARLAETAHEPPLASQPMWSPGRRRPLAALRRWP